MMIHLTKIDPAKDQARFYSLDLQPTLFGEWALIRRWGRIGTEGRGRSRFYLARPEAEAAMSSELRRRSRRGYVADPTA